MIFYNWKCNNTIDQTDQLVQVLQGFHLKELDCSLMVAPSAAHMMRVSTQLIPSGVAICAQNISPYRNGPYTGEISAQQFSDIGCTYALIGHSERRMHFFENDKFIERKLHRAIEAGLVPVLCIGENAIEKQNNSTKKVLENQLLSVLASAPHVPKICIAYEPVWSIGTGQTASLKDIEDACTTINHTMGLLKNIDSCYILYGGSVKSSNTAMLLGIDGVSGLLIGGASLDCLELQKIYEILKK